MNEWQQCESRTAASAGQANGRSGPILYESLTVTDRHPGGRILLYSEAFECPLQRTAFSKKINLQQWIEELVAHADIHAIRGGLGASAVTQQIHLTAGGILCLPAIVGLKGLN